MKNIFVPLFLVSLLLLSIFQFFFAIDYHIIQPIIFFTASIAALMIGLKKYKPGFVLISLSIGLLITCQFLKDKDEFNRTSDFTIPGDQYITVEGTLKEYPQSVGDHSLIFLETSRLEFDGEKLFKTFNVRIKVKGNLKNLYKGDIVSIDASLYKASFTRNFYPNAVENYPLVNKIHFYGYCKSSELVTLIKKTSPGWRILGDWRNCVREVIDKKYRGPEGLDKKGVFLQAIVIGERGDLSNEQEDQFKNAGVYHILSISGAHIGIIALLCLGILKFFKLSQRKRYGITALVLIVFLVISGFQTPAERAVFMALLIFLGRILFLDINIYNLVSLTGLFLLIRNPAEFLDAGYILTFSLTAAIVAGRRIFIPILKAIKPFKKIPHAALEFISVSISASLVSLPLSLFYFQQYPFAGFFAGLVLIPLTAAVTWIGILLIPLAPISPFLSGALMAVVDIPLRVFFPITVFFSDSLNLTIFRASPSIIWVISILIGFFLIPFLKSTKLKIILSGIILIITLFITLNIFRYNPERLEVFFLDVGQGDSEIVVFPGGDALLIDGGGSYFSDFEVGRKIVLPFILQKRIDIKWIAVSHHHPDHVFGIAEIIPILKPEELWISSEIEGEDDEEPGFKKLMRSVPGSTQIKRLNAPFRKKIGDCIVEFLYPNTFIRETHSTNNQSNVIKISDPNHSFLFPGDIEKDVEIDLSENSCEFLRSTVIKVPHHGSATSSTPGFLACVAPRLAVFSYALNNRFRFPHKRVIENYKNQQIRVLSTARCGGIKLISLPTRIQIELSK
jgi:competence protein ComEC